MPITYARRLNGRDPATEICGAYDRISFTAKDKERGKEASGVARQGDDAATALASQGQVIAKHYVEDDTSAFKKKRIRRFDQETGRERFVYRVIRPVWQEALQDLRDGVITLLMVDDLDRMARDLRDLEDAIEVVEHFNGLIVGTGGDIDLTTDGGRMAARIGVTMANKSSADTRRRVTRKHLALSTSGDPVGGIRPFGWGKTNVSKTPGEDRLKLHPIESLHLRRWLDMSLQGASWSEIVLDSRRFGVVGTRGKPMVKSSLRQIIYSPRNCGYRMFHGELAVDAQGAPVIGKWEPICTVEEWLLLTSNIVLPRTKSTGLVKASKYLLSGIARCGVCNTRMQGIRRRPSGKNLDSYTCPPTAEGGHQCVARNMFEVDRLVTKAIIAFAARRKPAAPIALGWDKQAQLSEAEQRRESFITDRGKGKLTDGIFYQMLEIVEDEIKELRRSYAAWLKSKNQQMLATTHWDEKSWNELSVNEKRVAMSSFIIAVEIHRTDPGNRGGYFDPTKIKIIWREKED